VFSCNNGPVAGRQNITLSLPLALLRRVKRLAAEREISVSALMAEALEQLSDQGDRLAAARRRSLAAMAAPASLGSRGRAAASRESLHER